MLGLAGCATPRLPTVGISADQKGFVLQPSGERFVPWGHNYASTDLMERLEQDPGRVERDFADLRAAGTTVVRVHPEMPRFLLGPDQADPRGIATLKRLLAMARHAGLRLHLTGLACYRPDRRLAWYDAMDEDSRWRTQAFFWETIARTCAGSDAIFCYDLANEPTAVGPRAEGWYQGRLAGFDFCQRLSLDARGRTGGEILRDWTDRMTAAIRRHDRRHLITIGMLPFPGAYREAAARLDFVSPHLYPTTGDVEGGLRTLRAFDFGRPIQIGETFPFTCGADDERDFLLRSRGLAAGWIGHWPDEPPARLEELRRAGQMTVVQGIWLSWTDLFRELGPEMLRPPAPGGPAAHLK